MIDTIEQLYYYIQNLQFKSIKIIKLLSFEDSDRSINIRIYIPDWNCYLIKIEGDDYIIMCEKDYDLKFPIKKEEILSVRRISLSLWRWATCGTLSAIHWPGRNCP